MLVKLSDWEPPKTQSLAGKADSLTCSESPALTVGSGLKLGFLTQEGKPPTHPEIKDQRQQTLRLCVRSHHRARPSGTEVDESSGTRTSLPGSPWDGSLASSQNQVVQTF